MIKSFKNLVFVFLCLFFVFPAFAQAQTTWTNPWSGKTVSIPDGWAIIPKDAQPSQQQAFTFFDEQGNSFFVSATPQIPHSQLFKFYIEKTLKNNNLQEKSQKTLERNNVRMISLSYHEDGLNPHDGDILFGQQYDILWQIQVSLPLAELPTASQDLITNIYESFIEKNSDQKRSINLVQPWQNPWTYKSIDIPQWWTVQNNISQCSVKFSSYLSSTICINVDKSSASAQQAAKAFASSKKLNIEDFQSGSIYGVSFYASPLIKENNSKVSHIIAQIGDHVIFIKFDISDKLNAEDTKNLSLILSDVISTFVPSSFTPEEKTYNFEYNTNAKCAITSDKLDLIGETVNKNQGSFNIAIDNQEFKFQNQQAGFLWMNISGNVANIQNIKRTSNNLSIQFVDQFSIPYSVTYNNLNNDCLGQLRAFFTKADISQIDLGAPKATNN